MSRYIHETKKCITCKSIKALSRKDGNCWLCNNAKDPKHIDFMNNWTKPKGDKND